MRRAAWVIWILLVFSGCDSPSLDSRDPVCGDPGMSASDPVIRLARRAEGEPLFNAAWDRRHWLNGSARDTVTGFREIELFEKEIRMSPGQKVYFETFPDRVDLAREGQVIFSRRIRRVGETNWNELDWFEVAPETAPTAFVAERLYRIPFDLTTLGSEGGEIEIGLSAFVSPHRRRHAWETPPLVFEDGTVLLTSLGTLEGARAGDRVAWRLLACREQSCECVFSEVAEVGLESKGDSGWRSRTIDLGKWAGRAVVLHFETETLSNSEQALDPGLWADPELFRKAKEEERGDQPNLLIISLDTLGSDHLGLYGYPRDTSPFIDDVLAPAGTTFLHALAPATTTGPSHMTLLTSIPPSIHGVVSNLGGRSLPDTIPTLAETLRQAGYVTAAITENGAISRNLGFGRGFDRYEENLSAQFLRPEGHIEATFSAGHEFAARMSLLPWFVFLQTYQVHYPYTPPPAYQDLFEGDGLDPPEIVARFGLNPQGPYHPMLYDREIRFADDQLKKLIENLERDDLLENTIIVVLSDHGEAFFEHTYIGHGTDLHRETVRVPLIFVGPGVPTGRFIKQPVGLADVMPTVLDLLGVPIPPNAKGRSLVPLFSAAVDTESRPIFSEAWQTTGAVRSGLVELDQPTYGVELGRYKLIRYRASDGFRYAFFDVVEDPQENRNLAEELQLLSEEQRKKFNSLSTLLADYEAVNRRMAESFGVAPDTHPTTEIEPERLEKLRALGYVQ